MTARITSMQNVITTFGQKITECKGVEEVFNTILAQATEVIGGEAVTLDTIRDTFSELVGGVETLLAFARANIEPFAE